MIFLGVILALVVYLSVTKVDRTENKEWDIDELDEPDAVDA